MHGLPRPSSACSSYEFNSIEYKMLSIIFHEGDKVAAVNNLQQASPSPFKSHISVLGYPEQISFHFFIPVKVDDRVSFYKLKVLFPHSKLEFLGQGTVRDRIMAAHSMGEFPEWPFYEIAPFVIPAVYPALRKFVYVSPHVILKGRAEDMLRVNLQNFGVALSEDCSKRLSSYINFDVLDAIQRTAAKPWVSTASYSRNACMPDLSLVLIDSSRLASDLLEAILWWTRVLNKNERDGFNSAVALPVYDHYMKLKMEQRNLTQRYGDGKNF